MISGVVGAIIAIVSRMVLWIPREGAQCRREASVLELDPVAARIVLEMTACRQKHRGAVRLSQQQ